MQYQTTPAHEEFRAKVRAFAEADGRHSPRPKISAPASSLLFPAIYALLLPRPFPLSVTNPFIRYIGCRCIGFQIGRP